MKKLILLLGWGIFFVGAAAQDFPFARYKHAMASHGSFIYLFGGRGETDLYGDLWRFDPESDLWERVETSNSPEGCYGHAMAVIGNKLYTYGGFSTDSDNNHSLTWCYDPDTRSWERLNVGGASPEYLANYASAVLNNRWYIFGGVQNDASGSQQVNRLVNTLYEFDAAGNRWSLVAAKNPPPEMESARMVAYDDFLWVFGGKMQDEFSYKIYRYDTHTLEWEQFYPLKFGPRPRSGHILLFLMDCVLSPVPSFTSGDQYSCNPRMYLTGGDSDIGTVTDQWNYNFNTQTWEMKSDVPNSVIISGSEAIADPFNNVYIFGGLTGAVGSPPLDNFYRIMGDSWSVYDRDEYKWERLYNDLVLTVSIQPPEAVKGRCRVIPDLGTHYYAEGEQVDLQATDNPANGWYFSAWRGIPGGSSPMTNLVMDDDYNAVAVFSTSSAGIPEIQPSLISVVYPIPARETLNVSQIPHHSDLLRYSLITMNGQLIRQENRIPLDHSIRIDVQEVPSGVYYLKLECQEWVHHHKVIIQ